MARHEVTGERNLPDKLTALKNLSNSLDMKLNGYKTDSSNDSWKIAGQALASSFVITQLVGITSSFSESANLLTTKDMKKFLMEFMDAFYKGNGFILNCQATKQENHRAVLKMFKDTMSNIGDIITGSKTMMGKVFDNQDLLKDDGGDTY